MGRMMLVLLLVWTGAVWSATYYIDYETGNDTATGLTKQTAWKCHPFMAGFTGAYTFHAGDIYILKGGVTWPNAAFPLVIQNAWNKEYSGLDTAWNIVTVDRSWYSGATWTRPVFDLERIPPAKPIQLTGHTNWLYYWKFEQLEIKNHYCNGFAQGAFAISAAEHILIRNCYIHDWKPDSIDHKYGGVICNGARDVTVDSCVIHGAEVAGYPGLYSGFGTYNVPTVSLAQVTGKHYEQCWVKDFIYNPIVYGIGYPFYQLDLAK